MIQLVMTVSTSGGRVQRVEFARDMERYSSEEDRAEAHRLHVVMQQRVRRFGSRRGKEGAE